MVIAHLSLEAVFNGRGCLSGNFSLKVYKVEPFIGGVVHLFMEREQKSRG